MTVAQKKVILIDDDFTSLKVMSKTLQNAGFEVFTFNDWEENTMDEISAIAPDIIILDEFLQNTRGSLLCPVIKSVEQFITTPIILVSGMDGLEEIAKKCKADAYLCKPVTRQEIEALFNRT